MWSFSVPFEHSMGSLRCFCWSLVLIFNHPLIACFSHHCYPQSNLDLQHHHYLTHLTGNPPVPFLFSAVTYFRYFLRKCWRLIVLLFLKSTVVQLIGLKKVLWQHVSRWLLHELNDIALWRLMSWRLMTSVQWHLISKKKKKSEKGTLWNRVSKK